MATPSPRDNPIGRKEAIAETGDCAPEGSRDRAFGAARIVLVDDDWIILLSRLRALLERNSVQFRSELRAEQPVERVLKLQSAMPNACTWRRHPGASCRKP